MLIEHVYSQIIPSERGDYDDCWVVATIQAMLAAAPWLQRPTITEFRLAAGDPDDGIADGGNNTDIMRGIRTLWPDLAVHATAMYGWSWTQFDEMLRAGHPISASLWSGSLPLEYRYGFNGAHQVCLFFENGTYYIANPLQSEGSRPRAISATALRKAVLDYGQGYAYGVAMPTPDEARSSDMRITKLKYEEWTPTVTNGISNGVLRATPDLRSPILVRLPANTTISTVAEVETNAPAPNHNWRLTEWNRAPAFLLRRDAIPRRPGGDPATEKFVSQLVNRKLTALVAAARNLSNTTANLN